MATAQSKAKHFSQPLSIPDLLGSKLLKIVHTAQNASGQIHSSGDKFRRQNKPSSLTGEIKTLYERLKPWAAVVEKLIDDAKMVKSTWESLGSGGLGDKLKGLFFRFKQWHPAVGKPVSDTKQAKAIGNALGSGGLAAIEKLIAGVKDLKRLWNSLGQGGSGAKLKRLLSHFEQRHGLTEVKAIKKGLTQVSNRWVQNGLIGKVKIFYSHLKPWIQLVEKLVAGVKDLKKLGNTLGQGGLGDKLKGLLSRFERWGPVAEVRSLIADVKELWSALGSGGLGAKLKGLFSHFKTWRPTAKALVGEVAGLKNLWDALGRGGLGVKLKELFSRFKRWGPIGGEISRLRNLKSAWGALGPGRLGAKLKSLFSGLRKAGPVSTAGIPAEISNRFPYGSMRGRHGSKNWNRGSRCQSARVATAGQSTGARDGVPYRNDIAAITGGGQKSIYISLNLEKLQDKTEIHTATFQESLDEMEERVKAVLLDVLHSANPITAV